MRYLRYPFQIDRSGRTAVADFREHSRQLIEQTLFTYPGERVNRPDFGSQLNLLMFASLDPERLAEITNAIRTSLAKFLSDLITVEDVTVSLKETSITVIVTYITKKDQERNCASFDRGI